jgi:FtsH-binding integral membrane protein
MSVPIPSPYFPEPITVQGNVADAGYRTVVQYSRTVAMGHLLSVAALVALAVGWMEPQPIEWLLSVGAETVWVSTLVSFCLLAFGRHWPVPLQLLVFSVFSLGVSGTAALWAPVIVEDFPDFAKALGCTFASGWIGLVIYNIAARRDYSFFGQYVLVWLFTALTTLVYTWLSDIVISLASASFIVFSVALFCYLYDLSMILRRRLPKETVVGALDLYRDALNFVGFPVRVMRRPRGLRRNRT